MKGCITFMHCYSTVVTLDYFISIFTVISKANATNQNMVHFLGTPILRLLKDQWVLILKNGDTWVMPGISILFIASRRAVICSLFEQQSKNHGTLLSNARSFFVVKMLKRFLHEYKSWDARMSMQPTDLLRSRGQRRVKTETSIQNHQDRNICLWTIYSPQNAVSKKPFKIKI